MDDTSDETEGTTRLNVLMARDGDLMVWFSAVHGGARNWRELADSFGAAIRELPGLGLDGAVIVLDEKRRLGQGGARKMCGAVFHLVWAVWDEHPAVSSAFRSGALVVATGGLLQAGWMRRARALLARQRYPAPQASSVKAIGTGTSEIGIDDVDGVS